MSEGHPMSDPGNDKDWFTNFIDESFGDHKKESPSEEDFYPGSRRKRREKKADVEFIPDDWHDDYVLKMVRGTETPLFPVGALATALGVSVPSVRRWSSQGRIPMAPYRLESNMIINGKKVAGRRYYTKAMIDAVVEVFAANGVLGSKRIEWDEYPDIPIEIHDKWQILTKG